MKNIAKKAFYNIDGAWCTFWIVVQQLVVTSSTVFIIKLIESLSEKNTLSIRYLLLFVGSLIFVYLPTALSHTYLKKFKYTSFFKYIDSFSKKNSGKTTLSHASIKKEHESWLSNESYIVYDESTLLMYDVFSSFLNVVVSIVAIAYMLNMFLIWGYVGAFLILYVSSRMFKGVIDQSSLDVQKCRKNLSTSLLSIWDNVFIGNDHSEGYWKKVFGYNLSRLKESEVKYTLIRAWISSVTVALALLSIAVTTSYYIHQNTNNQTALAALIVTLPRQIQIIQRIFAFFGLALEWQGMIMRLRELEKPFNLTNSVEQYCNWEKIKLNSNSKTMNILSTEHFVDLVKKNKNGRFCLQGDNGSGKSSALLFLAEHLGDQSYYVPTSSDLVFDDIDTESLSEGQKTIAIIGKAKKELVGKVVVLDEWDANLDQENVNKVDKDVEVIAENNLVVEVRHFKNTEK